MLRVAAYLMLLLDVLIDGQKAVDFLSKFNQNDYKVLFERIDSVSYNPSMMRAAKFVTFKYNRTMAVVNMTWQFKNDLHRQVDMVAQAYKFASNEYRPFPVRFQVNFCDAIDYNIMGFQNSFKCGNFTGCPLKKDMVYQICNYHPDESKFPPLVPSGRYMSEISLITTKTELPILSWKCYLEIYYPMKYYE